MFQHKQTQPGGGENLNPPAWLQQKEYADAEKTLNEPE
jgi:hypothetical protein